MSGDNQVVQDAAGYFRAVLEKLDENVTDEARCFR